jgi:hypothetical protein
MPPSKAVEWTPEQKHFNFPMYQDNPIFTCVLDRLKRPSAIPNGQEGKKVIVIVLEE